MRLAETVGFGGGGLQRHAHLRTRMEAFRGKANTNVLPVWHGRPLVQGEEANASLAILRGDSELIATHAGEWVFLGLVEDAALFAVDVSAWDPEGGTPHDPGPGRSGADVHADHFGGVSETGRFADLRGLITRLGPLEAEIAATAKGILQWHASHGFCAACGAPTEASDGGWQRVCLACGRRHFPRTDPVVIMLVTRGNTLLVGRSPGWPENFYSLLAGFMEPGETVAAAVRREVAEETGVPVGNVRMLATQPWPFPASLMIGCQGEALGSGISLDPNELEDALWVSREELLDVFAGIHPRIATPRKGAIAHFLMKLWLADRLD